MATKEFPYVKYHERHYPMIPVQLIRFGKHIDTVALIDSGSNYSIFQPELAKVLGIPIDRGKLTTFSGISAAMEGHIHRIQIKVFDEPFECEVAFTRKLYTSFNILGRIGLFDRHEITFKEKENKVILTEL